MKGDDFMKRDNSSPCDHTSGHGILISIMLIVSIFLNFVPCARAEENLEKAEQKALSAIENVLREENESIWVYHDFGDTENHFTQKALMAGKDTTLVHNMDENWTENPCAGRSCIRCEQILREGDWGGWLFLNGWLPEDSNIPQLNNGSMPGQGLNLTGAKRLSFWARGEEGGEKVEFLTCGFGYTGPNSVNVDYPDSCSKQSLGVVTLTDSWEEYVIDLNGLDLSSIALGFGYALAGKAYDIGPRNFYLDEIRFEGNFSHTDRHVMLRSYDTENLYIQNAAFSYDNALAAMALISAGKQTEAEEIINSFLYAVEHDRYLPGRVRNAYAAGDITAFPGWGDAARLTGWYDAEDQQWYEDRYQTGSNVGNTSYTALALLQYDANYGCERCVDAAAALMDWVIDTCGGEGPGFTGGYDGWPEGGEDTTYVFTYKSIEHNIDAYAAFQQLWRRTGDTHYRDAAESALKLIDSMYDTERGVFYTGTLADGVTPNTGNIVLDAQVWACLALGDAFAPYEASLGIVEQMRSPEGAYPFCLANVNGGWWAEGTAYTALMYRLRGEAEAASAAMDALCSIQLESGFLPAATVDNLSTGFDLFDGSPWEYGNDPHLAPTAWFVMAVNNFNPYAFS